MTLTIVPVVGIPEVRPGDEVAVLIADAAAAQATPLADGDCLVVTQKVISKAEGRLVALDPEDRDARRGLIESESVRVLRRRGDLIISETRHGFVCANAGVDLSNVEAGTAALLPVDPDRSARHVRDTVRARVGVDVAVVISDTFGRAWRLGLTDVAIGVAGLAGVVDLRGEPDALRPGAPGHRGRDRRRGGRRRRARHGQGGPRRGGDRARPGPPLVSQRLSP